MVTLSAYYFTEIRISALVVGNAGPGASRMWKEEVK